MTLLVHSIGALLTPEGVVSDAGVVADNGRISWLGAISERPRLPPDVEELDARGGAVVPGFVDAHTHAVWAGERAGEYEQRAAGRTYEEIAASGGGIRATTRATSAASVDDLVALARPRLRAMASLGTTTVEVKSGYGEDLDAEVRMLEAATRLGGEAGMPAIVTTYLPLHAAPEGDRRAHLRDVLEEGIPAALRAGARFIDAFCEVGAWSPGECGEVLAAGRRAGLVPRLHTEQRTHTGGCRVAADVAAVAADHLEWATDDDLRALATAGVCAVLLPGAALVLGGPPPPGRRALAAGATIAIATDCNPGTCWAESMPLMVSLAVATSGLTPAQALTAATAGGAAALGLGDRGALEVGSRCDLVVLHTPEWRDVAYHLGGDVVAAVVAAGRVIG